MARKSKTSTPPTIRTLEWVPSRSARRSYELRSGTDVLGRLRWPKMFGSLAEGEFGDQRWTFKRGGFLRPRVLVRPAGSDENAAVFEMSFGGGGLLRTNTGQCFQWSRQGFWSQQFVFSYESGSAALLKETRASRRDVSPFLVGGARTRSAPPTRDGATAIQPGAELLTIEPKVAVLRRTASVNVQAEALDLPELPLLLLLGWYVTILIADDGSAAVVACCS